MTNNTIMELTKTVRKRYHKASRKEKSKILDEYCANTNRHRKSAIRAFNNFKSKKSPPGRQKKYTQESEIVVVRIWNLLDNICPERFHPKISKHIDKVAPDYPNEVRKLVCEMSLSTVKRVLAKQPRKDLRSRKRSGRRKEYVDVPINPHLRKAIKFGSIGLDLVEHNGGDQSGEFCRSLTLADVSTLWTTNAASFNGKQNNIEIAFDDAISRFPDSDKAEIHPDNENALIATSLLKSKIKKLKIHCVTRSRAYKKNDNCHVEERNLERVRKHVGFKRYTRKHLKLLNTLYPLLDDYSNFFIPSVKLVKKVYDKKTHKLVKRVYDEAKTPYERVLDDDTVDTKAKMKLKQKYRTLDVVELKTQIDKLLHKLRGSS